MPAGGVVAEEVGGSQRQSILKLRGRFEVRATQFDFDISPLVVCGVVQPDIDSAGPDQDRGIAATYGGIEGRVELSGVLLEANFTRWA